MKSVSVVILSFNSEQYLSECLDSVLAAFESDAIDGEIFVVDNGSSDASPITIEQYATNYPGIVKFKLNAENEGTTVPRNYALRKSSGKYILVLDSDAFLRADTLPGLIRTLESSPKIGLVAPRLVYPSGNYQQSTDVFPTLWVKAWRLFFLKASERARKSMSNIVVERVDCAISACWLLSRECLDQVGLLDERIFYSPEDIDYCIRVWKAGFEIVYDGSVEITHDAQEISRRKLNRFFFSHIKGLFYLFFKHRYGVIRQTPLKAN